MGASYLATLGSRVRKAQGGAQDFTWSANDLNRERFNLSVPPKAPPQEIRPYQGKPMVNSCLIRPYFLGVNVALGGPPLGSP